MTIFLILPDSSKSGTFQEYIQEIFLAAEFQSRCNLRKSITVIQFLLIHPFRYSEVEHQHFADLRIRKPAGMPAGDESSLRLDIDAGGERLDGVAACHLIARIAVRAFTCLDCCVVCHNNYVLNVLCKIVLVTRSLIHIDSIMFKILSLLHHFESFFHGCTQMPDEFFLKFLYFFRSLLRG